MKLLKKLTGKISVLWLSGEDIKCAHLDLRFEKSLPVAVTQSLHYLRSNDDISLAVATNSPSTRNEPVNIVQIEHEKRDLPLTSSNVFIVIHNHFYDGKIL